MYEQTASALEALLTHAITRLSDEIGELEKAESGLSEPYFGKDSVLAALAKLVAMQKSLQDQAEQRLKWGAAEGDEPAATEPMREAEWQQLERSVARWREGQVQ